MDGRVSQAAEVVMCSPWGAELVNSVGLQHTWQMQGGRGHGAPRHKLAKSARLRRFTSCAYNNTLRAPRCFFLHPSSKKAACRASALPCATEHLGVVMMCALPWSALPRTAEPRGAGGERNNIRPALHPGHASAPAGPAPLRRLLHRCRRQRHGRQRHAGPCRVVQGLHPAAAAAAAVRGPATAAAELVAPFCRGTRAGASQPAVKGAQRGTCGVGEGRSGSRSEETPEARQVRPTGRICSSSTHLTRCTWGPGFLGGSVELLPSIS